MHALVYYVVRFVFVTLRVGALVRGPDAHRDIHLDPVSHPNVKDAGSTGVESSGCWSTVPAARKLVVSHFPLEERSSDEKGKDYRRWYTVRSEAEVVLKYFLFNLLTFIFKSLIFMGDKKGEKKMTKEMTHEEKIFAKHLPDFVTKKVDLKEASKLFKKALDKIAKEFAHDPKWETYKTDYKKWGGRMEGDMVGYEACPIHDWGVGYFLGSHPKSFNPMKNPQDWYLECHYGFDVIFTGK